MRINGAARAFFCLFLMGFFCVLAQAQSSSRVLVLKDGRSIAIQGEYEVFGGEVQFTHSSGEFMTLGLAKVDLEETERRNEALAKGEIPDAIKEGDGVIQHSAPAGGGRFVQIGEPEGEEEAEEVAGQDLADNPRLKEVWDQLELQGDPGQLWRQVNQDFGELRVLIFVGTLLFSFLLALGAQIFMIIRGFRESALWGVSLLVLTFLCPIPVLSLVVMLVFLINHCYPHRLALALMLFSPGIVAVVGFLFTLFL